MLKSRFGAWRVALLATLGVGPVASCGDGDDPGGSTGGASDTGGAPQSGGRATSGETQSGGDTTASGTGGLGAQGGGGADGGTGGGEGGWAGGGAPPQGGGGAGGLGCTPPGKTSGVVTRPSPAKCLSRVPRPVGSDGGAGGNGGASGYGGAAGSIGGYTNCETDFDCTEKGYGFCRTNRSLYGSSRYCIYGCTEDADCGSSSVCLCLAGDPVGTCHIGVDCKTNLDCTEGCACLGINHPDECDGAPRYSFACQTPDDTCRSNSQCTASSMQCSPAESGSGWECTPGAVCGRPFLVDGNARVAARAQAACGWAAPQKPSPDALTPELRRELVEHYTRLGLMEHASVAAFARFTLELMSLGAPATLLEKTQAALADEIQHAKLCFGLASAYGGRDVGPGPLAMDGVLDRRSHTEILETALLEACIGETIAAAEAALSSDHARDPELRAVFERIATDEARHAELGWAFMRWALERADEHTARRIVDTLYSAIDATTLAARAALEEPVRDDRALLAHGMLTPQLRAEARLAAVEELLLPCAQALTSRAFAAAA